MAACRLQPSVSHLTCRYVRLGQKISAQFLNCLVSTQSFHSKKFNQFVEIFISVAWPGVGLLGLGLVCLARGTREGGFIFPGALGTVDLLAIG